MIEPKEKRQRHEMPKLDLEKRSSFDEVEFGFKEEVAIEEAKRCLRCGGCMECSECIEECDKRLLILTSHKKPSIGMLLRVPLSSEKFPLRDFAVNGKIWWQTEEREERILVTLEPVTAKVNEIFCRGCGNCEEVCQYSACGLEERESGIFIAKVDSSICKGCGTCVSLCPSGAMSVGHFTNSWIDEFIERAIK